MGFGVPQMMSSVFGPAEEKALPEMAPGEMRLPLPSLAPAAAASLPFTAPSAPYHWRDDIFGGAAQAGMAGRQATGFLEATAGNP